MSVNPITNDDLKDVGVIGLDDAPGLSRSDMQAKFEETARSVIIPRLNATIAELNKIIADVSDLALEGGAVTPSQVAAWDAKLDATEDSYRLLTKCCTVGGSVGWFRLGSVELHEPAEGYSAIFAVQSAHTAAPGGRCGVVSVQLRLDSIGGALDASSSIKWLALTDREPESVAAVYDAENKRANLYIHASAVTERLRVSVISEGNTGGYEHLLSINDAPEAELEEIAGQVTGGYFNPLPLVITEYTSGDALEDNAVYSLNVSEALNIAAGSEDACSLYGSHIILTFTADAAITLNALACAGDSITDAVNGDVWEISVLRGRCVVKKMNS